MKSLIASLALLMLLAPTATAQTVHVVDALGNGTFLDVQSAIDAAVSGDQVLVKSGSYPGFTIDAKNLVVSAEAGSTVTIQSPVSVANIATGGEVVIHGLELRPSLSPLLFSVLSFFDCEGQVIAQDIDLEITASVFPLSAPVVVQDCSAVVMVDSRVDATTSNAVQFGGAILSTDSSIFLYGTLVRGAAGADGTVQIFDGKPGGSALELKGGSALVVGGDFLGGAGGDGSTFLNPGPGGDGGDGIRLTATLNSTPHLVVYDSLVAGGTAGTTLPPALDGMPGDPIKIVAGTVETPAAFERRLEADGVIRDGASTTISFHGQPFDLLWQIIAIDTNATTLYAPEILGGLYPGGSPFFFRFRGTLNAMGEKSLNFSLTPTGLDYVPLFEQALMFSATEGFVASNPRLIAFLNSLIP